MSGTFRLWSALAATVALAAAAGAFVWHRHDHSHVALRAGFRNNSLSNTSGREGRVDQLGVEVLAVAARRIGIQLKWVDCPEGPDRALRTKKVDLWPISIVLPERKTQFYISEPWLAGERSLVTKEAPPKSWAGLRVAYGLGPESQLLAAAPGADPVHLPGDVAAVGAICADQASAAYVLTQSLAAFVLRKPAGCEWTDFHVTPVNGKPLKLGIAASFEHAADADALRVEIGRMAVEGKLEELFNRYSLSSLAETANIYELMDANRRVQVFKAGAAAIAVGFGILLWQVRRIREARRLAEKATNAKSEFLANMSHEIRTPLNGIVAMTEMLSRSGLTPEQHEMAGLVLTSSESLMIIVNDILDFSKIEAGGLSVEQIAFDPRHSVGDAVRLFMPRAKEKNLTLDCEVAAGLPPTIIGDPVRVRQVLMNLISNAIKFTAEGGIKVEVQAAGDPAIGPALLFEVTDTGIGIEPEISQGLFRAFSQADSATTRKYGGTGLGLAITLRLVTLMGGSVGMTSEPGRGSTFWFLIPARIPEPSAAAEQSAALIDSPAVREPDAAAAAVAPRAAAAAVAPRAAAAAVAPRAAEAAVAKDTRDTGQASRRILVVEDNPVNQIVASRALLTLGYVPEVVAGGEAALEALERGHFDLVLMDCQMPGMDGYSATIEIRRRERGGRRMPIVAMTANAVEGDRERCIDAGMDDYLSKPIRLAVLGKTLECWLGRVAEPA